MKIKLFGYLFVAAALLPVFNGSLSSAYAQGTGFTYQGQLSNGTNPVTGLYSFKFDVFANATGGASLVGPVTNTAVPVTNGLFTTIVDFGANAFTGTTSNWLRIEVVTNTGTVFTVLLPRQELTPTPYAIYAEGGNAAGLTGTVPTGDLSLGGVDGSGLINLNATDLTSGTVADARLAPDVAFTDVNQIFTGQNTFTTGTGSGRLTVNGSTGIDTSLFTGLGFQYFSPTGEGAIMSSYNDGYGLLSFYTKHGGGFPILKQMTIDYYGGVAIDQQNANNGVFNNGTTNGVGLSFGTTSGEGIASKRTAGGNQWGLDFYTSYTARMSINNNGFVGIGRSTPIVGDDWLDVLTPVTNTWGGMYIETAGLGQPFYGYSMAGGIYAWTWLNGDSGANNSWNVYDSGGTLTLTPSSQLGIGIGSATPTAGLEVASGNIRADGNQYLLETSSGIFANDGMQFGTTFTPLGINDEDGPFIGGYLGGALGGLEPNVIALSWDAGGDIWVSNNCSVGTLTIRGGADLAEPFNISSIQGEVSAGAVVVIDEQNPGHLKLSDGAYDTHVAGVVSGANGIHPGIQMHQEGILEGGKNVALTGRVYVQADASNGAIRPGDMLTTSSIPGYAMKVTDHARAVGAILGKAMTGLSEGKGMVLVLVTLQ